MSATVIHFPAPKVAKRTAKARPAANTTREKRLDRMAELLADRAIRRRLDVERRFGMPDEGDSLVTRLEEIALSRDGLTPPLKKRMRKILRPALRREGDKS